MAPSQRSVLALLGLIASVHAVPAVLPAASDSIGFPSNEISLGQPSFTVTWETGAPATTDEPEDPVEPTLPVPQPTPSNEISLGPPSYSISWDGIEPAPEKPTLPPPSPPSSSRRTRRPTPIRPTNSVRPTGPPGLPTRYSVTWETAAPQNTGGVSWDLNKRQFEEDPPVTESTVLPPQESDPPELPPILFPTPPNSIGIQPPRASISWGRRQYEEDPDPVTEDPEFPSVPPIVFPTPSNDIGLQPSSGYLSWGKRAPAPLTNTYVEFTKLIPTFVPPVLRPTYEISWNKRQDLVEPTDGPSDLPLPTLFPTPSDQITVSSPDATISWGRRAAEAAPQSNDIGLQPSSGYLSWGKRAAAPQTLQAPTETIIWGKEKREAEAEPQDFSLIFPSGIPLPTWWLPKPSSPYISWGKRDGSLPTAAAVVEEREAEAEPQDFSLIFPSGIPLPTWWVPKPTSTAPIYISWGRREPPLPTAAAVLEEREEAPESCLLTTTVSRVRICPQIRCMFECPISEPLDNEYEVEDSAAAAAIPEPSEHQSFDCPATVTAYKKCPFCSCTKLPTPITTKVPTPTTKAPNTSCSTVTYTIVPPCVPPVCPDAKETPCDFSRPIPKMQKVKRQVIEKRVVTIKTVAPPVTPLPPVVDRCTAVVTKTVVGTCPTYTCVPWQRCDAAQVVR